MLLVLGEIFCDYQKLKPLRVAKKKKINCTKILRNFYHYKKLSNDRIGGKVFI